jgi:diguanylate cyclase (GGDEF)-like protein
VRGVTGRIALLFVADALVVVALLFVLRALDRREAAEVARDRAADRQVLLERVIEAEGRPPAMMAVDYTRWDDMVEFVASGDPAFVAESIEPGMETYGVDRLWILRPDRTIASFHGSDGSPAEPPPPWPAEADAAWFGGGKPEFRHYFAALPEGVIEVRVAPIQPDADLDRATAARGWFVAGRWWDGDLLERLAAGAGVSLEWAEGEAPSALVAEAEAFRFVHELPGWDGRPAARLTVRGRLDWSGSPQSRGLFRILAVVALASVMLVVSAMAVRRLVSRPLRMLVRSLDEGNPASLAPLDRNRSEFGRLAGLLRTYFDQRDRLEQMARHDGLTGLANRTLMEDRLRQALARCARQPRTLAVVVMDLDGFKDVNDSWGHDAGDVVLRVVAARLAGLLRASDTVARLGGDEFAVVLPDLDGPADAGIVCRRIVESVSRPIPLKDREVRVGASVGIAVHPGDGDDPETLLERADAAMYRVKARGKGDLAFFSEAESVASLERAAWSASLLSALDRGELEIRFQPRVAADGGLAGVEVVPWWVRPEGGTTASGELMRTADRTGLSRVLAERVIDLALARVAEWRARGIEPPVVSICLCARALGRPEFVEELAGRASKHGVPPGRVELRFAADDIERRGRGAKDVLQCARKSGFRVALDRFVSGGIALGRLGELPVDALHVDESLVRDLGAGGEGRAVLAAVSALARGLGEIEVVADGVDSPEKLALVRSLGCTQAQGPAVSPAIDAVRFEGMIARGKVD